MSEQVVNRRCATCFFQGRSTGTCDYIFIVDQMRPCPPGADCTEYISRREGEKLMRKAGWDTEAGRQMWLDGMKDSEIADAFGIKTSIVTTYRKRKWEGVIPKGTLQAMRDMPVTGTGENNPPAAACAAPAPVTQGSMGESEEPQENIPQAAVSPLAAMSPVPTESITGDGSAAHEREQSPDMPPAAARYSFDFAAGTRAPESTDTPDGSQGNAVHTTEQKQLQMQQMTRINLMDVLAQATEHLTGIRAVCTANAIQALWFWRNPEDLRLARNSIDYLLNQLEEDARYGK